MSLLLHCGSKAVSRVDVMAVPLPVATNRWKPVSYNDALSFVEQSIEEHLKIKQIRSSFGLNKKGNQMFAELTYDNGSDLGVAFGLRQSYNKSLSLGLAVGAKVFVCDNLCFSGDSFTVLRRNTKNVWQDFQSLVIAQVQVAMESHGAMTAAIATMREQDCSLDEGYKLLGLAQGYDVLTPHQASVAFGDWTTPRHEEFGARTLWSLYNAVTEGLKYGGPATVLDRHCIAHKFFVSQLTQLAN